LLHFIILLQPPPREETNQRNEETTEDPHLPTESEFMPTDPTEEESARLLNYGRSLQITDSELVPFEDSGMTWVSSSADSESSNEDKKDKEDIETVNMQQEKLCSTTQQLKVCGEGDEGIHVGQDLLEVKENKCECDANGRMIDTAGYRKKLEDKKQGDESVLNIEYRKSLDDDISDLNLNLSGYRHNLSGEFSCQSDISFENVEENPGYHSGMGTDMHMVSVDRESDLEDTLEDSRETDKVNVGGGERNSERDLCMGNCGVREENSSSPPNSSIESYSMTCVKGSMHGTSQVAIDMDNERKKNGMLKSNGVTKIPNGVNVKAGCDSNVDLGCL